MHAIKDLSILLLAGPVRTQAHHVSHRIIPGGQVSDVFRQLQRILLAGGHLRRAEVESIGTSIPPGEAVRVSNYCRTTCNSFSQGLPRRNSEASEGRTRPDLRVAGGNKSALEYAQGAAVSTAHGTATQAARILSGAQHMSDPAARKLSMRPIDRLYTGPYRNSMWSPPYCAILPPETLPWM